MIKVKITKKDTYYNKISLSGHALYDDYGKDIVCSAVSSIVITTINGLLTLDKNSLSYKINNDKVEITNIKTDITTQKLITNMVSLLQELEKNYQKNIEVK